MNVVFVGISNKQDKNGEMLALDINTPSGQIIAKVDESLAFKSLKTNLVNHTPLDSNSKMRYPNKQEIETGIKELKKYLRVKTPCLVFMLGKIVERSISKEFKGVKDVSLIAVKHPSYIYVYKRSTIDNYVNEIVETVRKFNPYIIIPTQPYTIVKKMI